MPFEQLTKTIEARGSVYGYIIGLRLDRAAPGEAWSSLPYRPVFVGDTETGVLHGGVVTAMLDESCGMAVQLALDGTSAIATLDLRIYTREIDSECALGRRMVAFQLQRFVRRVPALEPKRINGILPILVQALG